MAKDNNVLRSANELSLAAWFGGSLMGATGMRRAVSEAGGGVEAEGAGWSAWQPVQTLAIVTQLVSGAGLTVANRGRYIAQRGVARTSLLRTAVTGAAVAATIGAAKSGQQLAVVSSDAAAHTEEVNRLRSRTRMFQWLVPLLTGSLIVLDAVMGEQQRPQRVASGVIGRILPGR